jgi:hypothetical protein
MPSNQDLLSDALSGAAREIGSAVTPTDLRRLGIPRLRYVSREKMSQLLERAVEKALEERRRSDAGVSALVDLVQKGLLDLVRGAHDFESARRDVADRREALESELAALASERSASMTRDRTLATTLSEAHQAIRERDLAIDRLERRVEKLVVSLQATERALQRSLENQKLEQGIASLYHVVEGISERDPQVERKRAMMLEIFRANVELRAAFAQAAATSANVELPSTSAQVATTG